MHKVELVAMRCMSASEMKGQGKSTYGDGLPQHGKQTRLVYDALYTTRGREMTDQEFRDFLELTNRLSGTRSPAPHVHGIIRNLVDFWGCDIRKLRTTRVSDQAGAVAVYCLVGEWSGKVYIDYTAPAIERASGKSSTPAASTDSP